MIFMQLYKKKMEFKGKKILIISPSNWGVVHISKHHYSLELVRLGNMVFFLEPLLYDIQGKFAKRYPEPALPNLCAVTYEIPYFLYLLRFKARIVYNLLIRFYVRKMLKHINVKFDIIWCFDTHTYSDLGVFKGQHNIFHPVDILMNDYQVKLAKSAKSVFTVTNTVIKFLLMHKVHSQLINHGLNRSFEEQALKKIKTLGMGQQAESKQIKVGYLGNILRDDFNRELVIELAQKYRNLDFHLWGPYIASESNIGSNESDDVLRQIEILKSFANVYFHGNLNNDDLSIVISAIDIFLLVLKNSNNYDSSNSHKIIEYLSTGKVIVSVPIDLYIGTNLFEMANDHTHKSFVAIFDEVSKNLKHYNRLAAQLDRINYSLENTYLKQIKRIEEYINEQF